MTKLEQVRVAWKSELDKLNNTSWFRRLAAGHVTLNHYQSYLRETYFYTRENPQLQALATVYFREHERELIKKFYQHAISEIGHDKLALNDLATLGADVSKIPKENPLPSTVALTGWAFYEINYRNYLGYLGYLFHLEFAAIESGPVYIEKLKQLGVPANAMTFLQEHATIDTYHTKLMESYLNDLIRTQSDLDEVIWAAKTTCVLHGQMVIGALEAVGANDSFSRLG